MTACAYETPSELSDAIQDLSRIPRYATRRATHLRIVPASAPVPAPRRKNPTFERQLRDITDRGMQIVTAYLMGALDPVSAREIEAMLAEPFAGEIFGPVVAAWRVRESEKPDVDAAYARFLAARKNV